MVHSRRELQTQRYKGLVEDLTRESAAWITLANLDSKITPALFAQPATTGLITRTSDLWRYQVVTHSLHRVVNGELYQDLVPRDGKDRLQGNAPVETVKSQLVRDFLEPMVSYI